MVIQDLVPLAHGVKLVLDACEPDFDFDIPGGKAAVFSHFGPLMILSFTAEPEELPR